MDVDEFEKQKRLLSKEPWYRESLNRQEAQTWIKRNGEFLVRVSEHTEKMFILTTKWNGRFMHLPVKTINHPNDPELPKWLYSFEEFEFLNVVDLIKYHWIHQLPMTRQSEAVIYRPVNFSGVRNTDLNLNHTDIKPKNQHINKMFRIGVHSHKNTALTASVNDLVLLNKTNLNGKLSKGSSFHDLRLQSYATPDDILRNDLPASTNQLPELPGTIGSEFSTTMDSSRHFLKSNDSGFANPTDVNDASNSSTKPPSINRKAIRYVEMSQPSIQNLKIPPVMGRTQSTNDINSTCNQIVAPTRNTRKLSSPIYVCENLLNYDLSLIAIPNLSPLIGPVHRPMNMEIWSKIIRILTGGTDISSLEFAGQLILQTGKIFLDWPKKIQSEFDESDTTFQHGFSLIFMPQVSAYRDDILMRYRLLTLFVISTILLSCSVSERAKTIIFWLECCRCLSDIYRDNYSLGSLVQAVFSNEVTQLKSTWKEVQKVKPRLATDNNLENLRSYFLIEQSNKYQDNQQFITTGFYDLKSRVPNVCPLLNQLQSMKLETRQTNLLTIPDCKENNMLINAWKMLRSCPSENLWLRDICLTIDTKVTPITELVRTETLMLLFLGPVTLDGCSSANMLLDKVDKFLQGLSFILQ